MMEIRYIASVEPIPWWIASIVKNVKGTKRPRKYKNMDYAIFSLAVCISISKGDNTYYTE